MFWTLEYSFKELECQIQSTNTRSFLGENEAKLETLQKLSPSTGVSYKFVSKSVRSLNRIFSVIKYWFQALECQICSTNTNLSFWESKINLGTLEKLFPYIGVSYKFVLKSVKSLNRIFWAMDYSFKALQCQIWSTNTKSFFWKNEAKRETLQKLFLYI